MTIYISRILLPLFYLCVLTTQSQEVYNDQEPKTSFELVTGMTPYQLMNSFLRKESSDQETIKKQLQLLSDKLVVTGDRDVLAEWFYIKARIYLYRFAKEDYKRVLNNYNLFVKNNYGEGIVLAKQKLLDGYVFFYSGQWEKSLIAYEEALSLAKKQRDLLTILDSKKQIAYISTFSGDKENALNRLKELFGYLSSQVDSLADINKDIPLLKIKTLDLITRVYWFDRVSEVDSLKKYSKLYMGQVKSLNDPLEYRKMYTLAAYTALLESKFNLAERYLDSAKISEKPFSGKQLIDFVQAEIFYHKKRYKEGIDLVEINYGYADSLPETLHSFSKYDFKFLAKSYKMLGDYQRSNYYYEHFERANSHLDKIMDSVSLKIRKREIADFKRELADLASERKTSDSLLKYFILGGSLVVLILLIILYYFYKQKKKNEERFLNLQKRESNNNSGDETALNSKEELQSEKRNNSLDKEITAHIIQGLNKLEEQHYFLKPECNAYTTAKKIKTNTTYLSKVINLHYNKTFNAYINDLRIDYALVRLREDSRFRAFSIQSIAEEIGYKSADSFAKYFKKRTGSLPSFYIKRLNSTE